jgi:hypothetical protein
MDGRVQLPVIRYLQDRFNVEYIDSITEPGPNLILSSQTDQAAVRSIMRRVEISVEKHASAGIALVGHHSCAGNPTTEEEQQRHLIAGVKFLRLHYREILAIGIWEDEKWKVHEVITSEQGAALDGDSAALHPRQ